MKIGNRKINKWWVILITFAILNATQVFYMYGWKLTLVNITAWLCVFWLVLHDTRRYK